MQISNADPGLVIMEYGIWKLPKLDGVVMLLSDPSQFNCTPALVTSLLFQKNYIFFLEKKNI